MENQANTDSPEAGFPTSSGPASDPPTGAQGECPNSHSSRSLPMRPRRSSGTRTNNLPVATTDYWFLYDASLADVAKWQSNVERVWGPEYIGKWDSVEEMLDDGYSSRLPDKWTRSEDWPDEKMKFAARLRGWGLGGVFISKALACTVDEYRELFRGHPELEDIVKEERVLVGADQVTMARDNNQLRGLADD